MKKILVFLLLSFSVGAFSGFKEGSRLLSANGVSECLPIENIKTGDMVLSFDETTNEIVRRRVLDVTRFSPNFLVKIDFENGRTIECTKDHLFSVGEKRIPASKLREGLYVNTSNGWLQIRSISTHYLDDPTMVYDINVEDTLNYFVVGNGVCGEDEVGVLVH